MTRKRRRGHVVGCAAQKQKLTLRQVRQIKTILLLERLTRERDGRTRQPKGMRQRLADHFGISKSMVRLIIEKKRHKYVKVKAKDIRHLL